MTKAMMVKRNDKLKQKLRQGRKLKQKQKLKPQQIA
jgi:hypothetical protein